MGFDAIFRNKLSRPSTRPMLAGGSGERSIVWSGSDTGLLNRLEALELEVAQLRSRISTPKYYPPVDLDPDPGVTVTTGYELASDGTLRAYAEVTVSGTSLYEVALLGSPEVVYAAKDAYVDEANPTTISATGNILLAGSEGDGYAFRTWLQFPWGTYPNDLWAVDPVLAEVRLCKLGTNDDDAGLVLKYEDLAGSDWSESGGGAINWNNQPAPDRTVARVLNVAGSDYNWFDITSLFGLLREARSGTWSGEPYGLVAEADREDSDVGLVDWHSREGAVTVDQKPQLWYWGQAEKSQLMGGTVKTVKFYGKAGGTYYLVHRMLSKDNVPGRWSDPVEITLPSQGATPDTPSIAVNRLNPNCLTEVVVTYTEPADFLQYEIEERLQSDSSLLATIVTTAARFIYQTYQHGDDDTKFRVRAVTRSGVASSWSAYQDNDAPAILKYEGGAAAVRMSSPSTDDINLHTGDVGKLYKSKGVASPKEILTPDEFASKDLDFNMIEHSCGQATNDSQTSTTSTSWADRTTGSVTLTPPGSGNAYYLLIARVTLFKNAANGMKLTFKVDGTETSTEEAWSSTDVAETVTIVRRVAVSSGSSHTFKLCFKSNDGGECIIYKSVVVALHLGNY